MKREGGNARVMRRGYVGGMVLGRMEQGVWGCAAGCVGGWSRVCEAVQQGVWEDGAGCVGQWSRVCGGVCQGV